MPPPPPSGGETPPPPPPPPPAPAPGSAPPPAPGYPTLGAPVRSERAGFGIRLGAYLLDGLLYGLVAMVFVIPGAILMIAAFSDCVSFDDEILCPDGSPSGAMIGGGVALMILGVIFVFIIYVRALGKKGQTWGRKIVGIRVVGINTGDSIGVGKAVGRTLFAGAISANVFYLGYLWMIWDSEKQTWHDKVVGSIVVKV